ncbi:uncharacterized protein MP3633_2871 [Marinomonas primoryensis]|uniref:Uncharacterized protein n=1 Tax=Marinomonas primoryensis TaxID=178399 RepID=A0A859CYC4_9GAMM|nr:uncharacterized protein MP3633_2871 [Marinomonas primoryensis]
MRLLMKFKGWYFYNLQTSMQATPVKILTNGYFIAIFL